MPESLVFCRQWSHLKGSGDKDVNYVIRRPWFDADMRSNFSLRCLLVPPVPSLVESVAGAVEDLVPSLPAATLWFAEEGVADESRPSGWGRFQVDMIIGRSSE